jgi:phosphatidylserine/phosphatidylglycerophosphate/cardiolipin synthase-like enzyme
MYIDRSFGPTSPLNTTDRLTINGVTIENYFAAEEKVGLRIARTIARADSEILFMAFSFTQEDIGEAMLERAESGINVRGVYETSGSDTRFSYYPEMKRAGLANLQVRQDGNPRIMHHKVVIVDRSVVIFGSYNFSGNAEDSNDENILIVYDPEFANYFVEEFEAVWGEAKTE